MDVPLRPEGLSEEALHLWPDIAGVPTDSSLRRIRKRLKRDPDLRIEILSALTRFSEAHVEPISAAVALYISIAALGLVSIEMLPTPARAVVTLAVFGAGFAFYLSYLDLVARMEERRKQSVVWLRALESYLA